MARPKPKGKSPTPATAAPAAPTVAPAPAGTPWRFALAIFAALLGLYVATLAPSVVGGDSGELIATALVGGVPHPPGYPLFSLLARLFAALPLGGTPAFRVNLLSAVATAGAGALVALVVHRLTARFWAALVAAALFGTNANIWLHAVSTEVFGLNLFFVALAILLWLSVEAAPARKPVFRLAFACGLAMCNHHTFLFVGGPLMLRALWVARRPLGLAGGSAAIALGLLGLLPYGYLVLASGSHAAISWGDQTTWSGLLDHVLRRNYGTFSLGKAGGAFVEGSPFFATLYQMLGGALPRFAWVGVPLALAGLYHAARRRARAPLFLALILALYTLIFCGLSNLDTSKALYRYVLSRFFMQSDLLLSLFVGIGAAALGDFLSARWAPLARRPRALYLLGPALFLGGLLVHGKEANQRHNTVFRDFVKTAFATLPPRTILITMGDHLTGSVFYFHEVERWRPDLIHLDRELLSFPWYAERKRALYPDLFLPAGGYGPSGWAIKQLLDGNPTRPLVVIDRLDPWDQSWKQGYKLATNGLVHPLVPAARFPDFATWRARDRAALGDYDPRPALRYPPGSWEYLLGEMALVTQGGRGHLALVYANTQGNDPAMARVALELLEGILALAGGDPDLGIAGAPGMPQLLVGPSVYKDLGIGYEILSKTDPAQLPKVALAFEKFVARAPATDPDLAKARDYVRRHGRGR